MAIKVGGNLVIGQVENQTPPEPPMRSIQDIIAEKEAERQEAERAARIYQPSEETIEQPVDKKVSQYTMDMNINLDDILSFDK